MLKSLFNPRAPSQNARRQKHRTTEQLAADFDRAYDEIAHAVCLCEGLEIIAANPACRDLLAQIETNLDGKLINKLFDDQRTAEQIFSGAGQPAEIRFDQATEDQPGMLRISARPWAKQRNLWLVEWTDLTPIDLLNAQLRKAREHDAVTGALLPSAFLANLNVRVTRLAVDGHSGILANLCFDLDHCSGEDRDDLMMDITEKMRLEFGHDILISRLDVGTLTVFTQTDGNEEEGRFILHQIRRMCERNGAAVTLSGAVFPDDGEEVAELIEALELAQFEAHRTKEPTLFFPPLREVKNRNLQLERDMPGAISAGEITPHFQPVINATNGTIKGFEALIRWTHPQLGYVIPPDIIAIATGSGLLHRLTGHILQQTIAVMKEWPDYIQFAVNVTPSQLTGGLVDLVRKTVRDANIDPARLEIEVTEDALICDFEKSAHIFARLRAIGVAVAMDDFGAGYTSVGNLRKLEFTKIKIDKVISDGLPDDKRSMAIVRSLMFMAQELDVDITVEGIESEEQLDFLRGFDCGVQGYVFSRPLSASQLPKMMKHLPSSAARNEAKNIVNIHTRKRHAG